MFDSILQAHADLHQRGNQPLCPGYACSGARAVEAALAAHDPISSAQTLRPTGDEVGDEHYLTIEVCR